MFPDSEIAKNYSCGRTKATHLTSTLASDSIDHIKQVTTPKCVFSLATGGSSAEEDKFFPVFISHEDPTTGMITSSFLDMTVVNLAGAENIADTLKYTLTGVNLDLKQCLAFSSVCDRWQAQRSAWTAPHKKPEIYGMGCPCHLSTLAAKEGGTALKGLDLEDFVIDLFYHFDKSPKQKYLLAVCNDDDSEGKKPPSKRENTSKTKGGPREQRLVKAFKNPATKPCCRLWLP